MVKDMEKEKNIMIYRNGKGKEYDENGELKYEGEYLYGKRKKIRYI